MKQKQIPVWMFLPGTAFWILIGIGIAKDNETLIGIAVGMLTLTIVGLLARSVRRSGVERQNRKRIWEQGDAARAKIVSIRSSGGGINDHPNVEFELEVRPNEKPPYRAQINAIVSTLAIPRIQPDCEIDVRIDPQDPTHIIIDEALTPYGYK